MPSEIRRSRIFLFQPELMPQTIMNPIEFRRDIIRNASSKIILSRFETRYEYTKHKKEQRDTTVEARNKMSFFSLHYNFVV